MGTVDIVTGAAVILSRAEGASNVGAACRALKTMGLSRLVLAACPEFDATVVRTAALSAFDVYEAAVRHVDLAAALAPFPLAVGFSRRVGRRRKDSVPVQDLAAAIGGRVGVALVFGNERDGLSDAELALCDLACRIPASAGFPSLNLSHAVQLACWELRRAGIAGRPDPAYAGAASREAVRGAASAIADRLQAAGFFKITGRRDAELFLAETAARAGFTAAELDRFRALFFKLSALDPDDEDTARGTP